MFQISLYELDLLTQDYLKIACCTLELTNDYDCILKYLRKAQDQCSGVLALPLKIAEHILGITKSYQYLLTQHPAKGTWEMKNMTLVLENAQLIHPIQKLLKDEGKLIRETKDAADKALTVVDEKTKYKNNGHFRSLVHPVQFQC
ncbi:hypothetical protein INT47_004810 [Mucor saturninus]|uniref:Uncharacterized protein n=1 Tax=Mucor saturninus TaxID=64648 RepID=A0A8H7R420_9FUNG|nr:hypothetical protein INT47_004810 [Mucor saturninus]